MLDSIYHMTLTLLQNRVLLENTKILTYERDVIRARQYITLPK